VHGDSARREKRVLVMDTEIVRGSPFSNLPSQVYKTVEETIFFYLAYVLESWQNTSFAKLKMQNC
jgi:hypothetical protein